MIQHIETSGERYRTTQTTLYCGGLKTLEPWPTFCDVKLAYSVYPKLMSPFLHNFFILCLVAIWFNLHSGSVCLCQVECAWRVFIPV